MICWQPPRPQHQSLVLPSSTQGRQAEKTTRFILAPGLSGMPIDPQAARAFPQRRVWTSFCSTIVPWT